MQNSLVRENSTFDRRYPVGGLPRHVYADRDNAQRGARSEYLKLGRGTATFNITLARGRPELFPDVPVAVRGFKPAIDNTNWIASRVTHNLSDAGYTMGVDLEIRNVDIPR